LSDAARRLSGLAAMQLTVTGKQTEIGDALRRHVETTLDAILGKYFRTAIEGHAVFTRDAHLIRADVSVHIGRGIEAKSSAAASDYYPAFDAAAERLAKQLRRYKRRLRDYHAKSRAAGERPAMAWSYVLAPPEEEPDDPEEAEDVAAADGDANGAAPVVIAEMRTELPSLTVGEAVMRMDLADSPVLLFRNRSHGELNLVYRRGDGNIGWIDPALGARSSRS
jgi:ribosomal subunit interface protein